MKDQSDFYFEKREITAGHFILPLELSKEKSTTFDYFPML